MKRYRHFTVAVEIGKEYGEFLWANPEYKKYIATYGNHFNYPMLEYASKRILGENWQDRGFTGSMICAMFNQLGLTKSDHCTWYDLAYLANIAIVALFDKPGSLINTREACVRYAHLMSISSHMYDGAVFAQWIADMMECKCDCEVPFTLETVEPVIASPCEASAKMQSAAASCVEHTPYNPVAEYHKTASQNTMKWTLQEVKDYLNSHGYVHSETGTSSIYNIALAMNYLYSKFKGQKSMSQYYSMSIDNLAVGGWADRLHTSKW